MTAHVTTEVRTVYRSARGVKLTKHAAYIAAAKKLIADRCDEWNARRVELERLAPATGLHTDDDLEQCSKGSSYKCRIHTRSGPDSLREDDGEGLGLEYYNRLLPRLVRFLKYVDRRTTETP